MTLDVFLPMALLSVALLWFQLQTYRALRELGQACADLNARVRELEPPETARERWAPPRRRP